MKILAVDDDETILELLEATLVALKYEDAEFASSGDTALSMIAAADSPYDCILSDIQMPGMDGITLCKAVRALPEYHRTPIIMVTAMSDRSYIDRAFTAGATDYVTKPFEIIELTARLNMAKKLMFERALVKDSQNSVENLQEQLNIHHKHSISEPVEISGVERTIQYLAFENYLLQLNRISLFQSSVFALKISGITKIHKNSTASQFNDILHLVARAISSTLRFDCNFLSYRGDGIFVCIGHDESGTLRQELESGVQAQLDILCKDHDDPNLPNLELITGELVSLGVFIKSGTLTYLRKAVDIVENIDRYQQNELTSDTRTGPDCEFQKQPYRSLLDENLSKGLFAVTKDNSQDWPDRKLVGNFNR